MSPFKPERVYLFSLSAKDVATTVHFYRDVVGLSLLPHHDHPPALELENGAYLVIVEGQTAIAREPGVPPFPAIAFVVKDLDEAVEHLQANDVELPWGIEEGRQERWVKFYDPVGNLIEFVQPDGDLH